MILDCFVLLYRRTRNDSGLFIVIAGKLQEKPVGSQVGHCEAEGRSNPVMAKIGVELVRKAKSDSLLTPCDQCERRAVLVLGFLEGGIDVGHSKMVEGAQNIVPGNPMAESCCTAKGLT